MQDTEAFHGAKLALLVGERLVSILRDLGAHDVESAGSIFS